MRMGLSRGDVNAQQTTLLQRVQAYYFVLSAKIRSMLGFRFGTTPFGLGTTPT